MHMPQRGATHMAADPGTGTSWRQDLRPGQQRAQYASQLQCTGAAMKTATIPSLRVDPALRRAAEGVLQEGETLSGFMETALRAQIAHRQDQEAFIARGLASRDAARRSGSYHDAADVVAGLEKRLAAAKAKGRR